MGGEGLDNLTFNYPVRLSRDAQRISEQNMAYIDVLVRNAEGTHQAGIECQSALVHDNTRRGIADGNRITALQSMGYTMLQLSYDNLVNPGSFASFMGYLHRVLRVKPAPKTKRMKLRELEALRPVVCGLEYVGGVDAPVEQGPRWYFRHFGARSVKSASFQHLLRISAYRHDL